MTNVRDVELLTAMTGSYERLTGSPFPVPSSERHRPWDWLYDTAPFGLLAHDVGDDPRFLYANQTALRLFGYPRSELIGMPSRLSAAPGQDRDERARLFAELESQGFCSAYRGRRVSKSGRYFWIEDAVIWNVFDASDTRIAQAALLLQVAPEDDAVKP